MIQYQRAPVGQSKNKITKQGTLFDFFNDISTSRQQSFYLDEATYATICQHALATVQAKAMSSRSGKMFFGQEQLFNSHTKTVTSGIMNKQQKFIGHTYTLSTIQLAYKQYSTLLLQAIVSMRDLYELTNAESSSQARRYKSTAAAGKKYMTFINYSLYKMIPKILGNNQFLLSNRYGLISFADFFAAESQAYFSWSSRKQVSLHELETYNFNIFLNTR